MTPTPHRRGAQDRRRSPQGSSAGSEQRPVEQRLEIIAREAPDSDLVVQRLTVILHRASRELAHIYRQALADSGVSLPDYQVLRALVYGGAPYLLHPGELARECGQTQSTMTHRLDLLEERALVRRRRDPSHRARVIIELTAAGKASWRDAQRSVARAEEGALNALDTRDKERLTALLASLIPPD